MTKFFNTLMLVVAMSIPAFAQQTSTVNEMTDRGSNVEMSPEAEKMMMAELQVQSRAIAIDMLGLNTQQTTRFTPLFMQYQDRKRKIEQRRTKLVNEYVEEMKEDDTEQDEMNETADFIENFMELDIDEMELKKDMFDMFEDEIGPLKALDFFAQEDMFMARAKRKMIMDRLPSMVILVPTSTTSYQNDVDAFSDWKKVNIDGKVGVDHNFTYNGIEKLLTAAERMAMSEGISVSNFPDRKQMIMQKAAKLKENWKSLTHADLAREAFTETAMLLGEIANDSRFESRSAWTTQLTNTAKSIKPSEKLTNQADVVYSFFNTAEMIVNDLVKQANDRNVSYGADDDMN